MSRMSLSSLESSEDPASTTFESIHTAVDLLEYSTRVQYPVRRTESRHGVRILSRLRVMRSDSVSESEECEDPESDEAQNCWPS